jgi:hypothetical protein
MGGAAELLGAKLVARVVVQWRSLCEHLQRPLQKKFSTCHVYESLQLTLHVLNPDVHPVFLRLVSQAFIPDSISNCWQRGVG